MNEQQEEKKWELGKRAELKKRKSTKWERENQTKFREQKENNADNHFFLFLNMKSTEWSIYTIRHMTDEEALCVGKLSGFAAGPPWV